MRPVGLRMTRAQGQRGAARSPAAGRSGSSGSLRRQLPLPTRDPAPGRAGPSAGLSRGGACSGQAVFLAARPPKNPAPAGCGGVVPRRLERTRLLAGHLTPERKGRSGGEPRRASSPPRPAQAGLEGQRGALQSARLRAGVQGCHGTKAPTGKYPAGSPPQKGGGAAPPQPAALGRRASACPAPGSNFRPSSRRPRGHARWHAHAPRPGGRLSLYGLALPRT